MAKNAPGFPDPAQVAEGQDHDKADCQRHRVAGQGRNGRDDGVGTGGDRHRHRDRVADEQGGPGRLGHIGAEVVPAHDVGTAGLRIGADDVAIEDRHDRQHGQDAGGERCHQLERRQAGDGHQGPQHLLGGVGRGRHHVGRQDGQRRGFAQPLPDQFVAHQGRSEKESLDAVADSLRKIRRQGGVGSRGRAPEIGRRVQSLVCVRRIALSHR